MSNKTINGETPLSDLITERQQLTEQISVLKKQEDKLQEAYVSCLEEIQGILSKYQTSDS